MHDYNLSEREEEQDILFGVINRFIGYFTRQAVPNTSNDTSREYPFVAMDTRQAYEQIRLARNHLLTAGATDRPLSFIDIGCGIGNILLLAELMEFDIFGIEKDSASYSIACQLLDDHCVSSDDIWKFKRYSEYDVVYYFRPFSEKQLQLKFELHIENTLKEGGILIANRRMGNSADNDSRFTRLDRNWPVWVKTRS